MARKKVANKKLISRRKLIFIYGSFAVVFLGLIGRLCYLMIVDAKDLKAKAVSQWTSDVQIPPKRGEILDRNLQQLAVEGQVYRIDLDIKTINQTLDEKKISQDQLISQLADILGMKTADVQKIFNLKLPNGTAALSAILKRGVDKDAADKVKALNIRGIIISDDMKRLYKDDNLFAQVVGNTNAEGNGVNGVEYSYNKVLTGTPGKRVSETDSKNMMLPYDESTIVPPADGKNVVLTLDETIQEYASKAADQALKDNKANAVSITVMNPKNGEILAMVSKPDYNPNSPSTAGETSEQIQNSWENRPVQWTFEPGSIFKAITAETALEEGTQKATDTFVCNGSLNVSGTTIYCWQRSGHGTENFVQILENSCNVGFMEVGQKLGKERLYKHINIDKFGLKTGIDLPGESAGIVQTLDKVGPVELSNISFGQGIATTQVQYMAAFNAIANGGNWIRPHVMKEIGHYDDNNNLIVDSKYNNLGTTKIMDTDTVTTLRGYLEKVVSEGVGQNAYIEGYDIAGKTGTAQRADPKTGGYQPGKYVASFAGMAPYQDPKITLLISIDEPDSSNYYAGQTAAPVAKQLFSDIMPYINSKDILNN